MKILLDHSMRSTLHFILLFVSVFAFGTKAFSQSLDKEAIALQMNSCVASLTNLNDSPSMTIYERERKQLTDYLSKEGMVNIKEITDLREQTLGTIYQLKITQEERAVLKKAASIDKNSQKWEALSKGLSQVMVMVPLGMSGVGTMPLGGSTSMISSSNPYLLAAQATFSTLVTAARSAVDYNLIKNRQMSEEERAMWNIRKQDLLKYAELNTVAFGKINDIFKNYGLSDNMEVQPTQMSEFNRIISEPDARKRATKLEDCSYAYRYLNDYYYYLGMAYLDQGEFTEAEQNFNLYIRNAKKSHLFKVDDKLGCIYLAKLSYQKELSVHDIHSYIASILENLPHNGAALIQCAVAYYALIGDEVSAFELLRKGLYDDEITNKESILLTICEWLPAIKQSHYYREIKDTIIESINDNEDMVGLNSYLSLLVKCGDEDAWDAVKSLIWITGIDEKKGNLKKEFSINISRSISLNTDNLTVVNALTKDDVVFFKECAPSLPEGFSEQNLFKKHPILSEQPSLIPIFFQYDNNSRSYYVRRDLTQDYLNRVIRNPSQIENLKQFVNILELTDKKSDGRKALKKVAQFCRKNQSKTPEHLTINCKAKKGKGKKHEYIYCDSYYDEPASITSHMVSLNNGGTSSTYTGYTKIDKYTSFQPILFASHPENLLIVNIEGESNPVSVTFTIDGKEAAIYSIMIDGVIYYRSGIQIIPGEKNNKNDELSSNGEKKRRWSFRKKDRPQPTASQNDTDIEGQKREVVKKKSRKDRTADNNSANDSLKSKRSHKDRKWFARKAEAKDSLGTDVSSSINEENKPGVSKGISTVKSWFKRDKKEKK